MTSGEATVTVIDPPSDWSAMSGGTGSVLRSAGASAVGKPTPTHSFAAPATFAPGTYNGIFYQTNDGGMPAVSLSTAGFLTQCVVDAQGNYTGTIYIDGFSNSISGGLNAAGNGGATFSRYAVGLSDLGVALHLGISAGTAQMTGYICNWTRQTHGQRC